MTIISSNAPQMGAEQSDEHLGRSRLRVEAITSASGLRALRPEWQSLFRESGAAIPFATFEWAESWWEQMRQDRLALRDSLQIRALRNEPGRLVAVAPLVMTERPSVGPMRVRLLQFLGADRNITELRGLLALPGYERDAYLALSDHLSSIQWDWIRWSGLRADRSADIIDRRLSFRLEGIPNYLLTLPPSWDQFKAGLKRNIRESLRKCYNSLQRDGHVFELKVASRTGEVSAAVARFFQLHAARASLDGTAHHPNVFASPASRRFLCDVTDRLAKTGNTRVFELAVNGEIVATRIGFQFDDSLYLYYSGYNPEWGWYSVMTTTVAEAIRYAIGEGLHTVNLSTGTDVSKTRWGPREVVYAQGIQITDRSRSRLAYDLYQNAFGARQNRLLRKIVR